MPVTPEAMAALRLRGDELADATVEALFAAGEIGHFNTLMRWFERSGGSARRSAAGGPRLPGGDVDPAGLGRLGPDGDGADVLHRQQRPHLHGAVLRLDAGLLPAAARRQAAVRHPRAGLPRQPDGRHRPVHRVPDAPRRVRSRRPLRPGGPEGPSPARLDPPPSAPRRRWDQQPGACRSARRT